MSIENRQKNLQKFSKKGLQNREKTGIIDKDFIRHAKVAQLVARRIRNA